MTFWQGPNIQFAKTTAQCIVITTQEYCRLESWKLQKQRTLQTCTHRGKCTFPRHIRENQTMTTLYTWYKTTVPITYTDKQNVESCALRRVESSLLNETPPTKRTNAHNNYTIHNTLLKCTPSGVHTSKWKKGENYSYIQGGWKGRHDAAPSKTICTQGTITSLLINCWTQLSRTDPQFTASSFHTFSNNDTTHNCSCLLFFLWNAPHASLQKPD